MASYVSWIHWLINVQYSKGGPIIAVQVENEYGAYAKDKDYMSFIKEVRNEIINDFNSRKNLHCFV